MAEETNEREIGAAAGGPGIDPAAMAIALSGASREEADAFLRKQSKLSDEQTEFVRLQKERLNKEETALDEEQRLQLSHLRMRRFSDYSKMALEITVGLFLLVVVGAFCVMVWNAANDKGLVIEAFTVPPDMAARGLTGQAVASQLEDKLAAMQDLTDTARPANSYVNNWGDDIKVQIPDTGISIGEFYRALAAWLGHQTHISGDVYRSAEGISITAHPGGGSGSTVSGREGDFDALLQLAAEAIFARTQTYRYAIYLIGRRPPEERRKILLHLAREGETTSERAWALNGIGSLDAAAGIADLYSAVAEYKKAIVIKPDFALAWSNIGEYESTLAHDEAALDAYRKSLPLFAANRGVQITERSANLLVPVVQASIAMDLGDFGKAIALMRNAALLPDYSDTVEQSLEGVVIAFADMHDVRGARSEVNSLSPAPNPITVAARTISRFWASFKAEDWAAVPGQQREVERAFATAGLRNGIDGNAFVVIRARRIWPASAYASAAIGNFVAAHALIDDTPRDCYFCVRIHGRIDAAERNWGGAAYWLADAVKQAPSIPFAYTDWGAMLLAKGNYDSAIEKFREANQKGPRFADPLEMWGEALIAKDRSDLALAKFGEAAKYAPNWGRLHLKWGEALGYVGHKDDSRSQYRTASTLDLAMSDKVELAKNMRR